LKFRYSDNPTRKRGKTGIDFASLTLQVTKILVSQTNSQLQNSRFALVETSSPQIGSHSNEGLSNEGLSNDSVHPILRRSTAESFFNDLSGQRIDKG
jgi:hypothetical protein